MRPLVLPPRVALTVRQLATALLVVVASCGGLYAVAPSPFVTLSVENAGMDQITVYLDGRRVGVAMPGQTTCLRIRWMSSETTHVLSYRPTAGALVAGPAEPLMHYAGWAVRLGHLLRHDVLSLEPAMVCR